MNFKQMALDEYNSAEFTTRRAGINGKAFWNVNSSQFMFVPQLLFPEIPGAVKYVYTATDSTGESYSFEDETPIAPLTPIWSKLAVGFVTLTVEAIHKRIERRFLAGTRTFYKTAPFPGREALPPRACSYSECAKRAFEYVFEAPEFKYWLEKGLPDPEYYYNVYPSKMISAIILAMIEYSELAPDRAADALKLATNAADYLLSITYDEEYALNGVPPTYSFKGLNKEKIDRYASAAEGRRHSVMNVYPASVGRAYLALEAATGDVKYFEAARRIADYYKNTFLPEGSWYLQVDAKSGEHISDNKCLDLPLLSFVHKFYKRTGESVWKDIEDKYYEYIKKNSLDEYNWEAQFEDSHLSANYSNLTHYNANFMIGYIAENLSHDEKMRREAEELIRFSEDQFVVWGEHAPWNSRFKDDSYWYSPAALEQYHWYVPIDASTANFIGAFLDAYKISSNPLHLEKALALADSITRMQNPDTGVIPTHWMTKDCSVNLEYFWINCHIAAAFALSRVAKLMGEA